MELTPSLRDPSDLQTLDEAFAEGVFDCPDVGPLLSTDGLRQGDVLDVLTPGLVGSTFNTPTVVVEKVAGDIVRCVGLDHHYRHFGFNHRPNTGFAAAVRDIPRVG